MESLKAAVDKEWDEMSEYFMRKTCLVFCPRIEAMLVAKGAILKNDIANGIPINQ
uniref:Uncharacterized protein n=1 Tax=Lepeophtheirus salmonis TaxID=72036 RepID=A0A0K2VG33_LEPSM